jgi:imidazolonepropionase-like amidohydrolase
MPSKLVAVAAGGAVAALGAGLLVPVVAGAQDGSPSTGSSASPSPSAGTQDRSTTREDRREARQDELARLLAAELGISQDKVSAALDAVREKLRTQARADAQERLADRLDAAVAEGTLTRAQADAILEAAENGVLPRFGHHGRGHGFGGPMSGSQPDDAPAPSAA